MNFLIDLIVIAIIAVCILISAKRGFVKAFVEVVGFIAAIILTFTISTPLATATYDKIIEPSIVESVKNAIADTGESVQNETLDALPDFIVENSAKLGFDIEEFKIKITTNLSLGTEKAVENASQDIIKPIFIKILGLIYSIILLLVMLIVVKLLAKIVNKLFSFSIVGKVNSILGGVIGIPVGVIFAMLFCMLITLLIAINGGFWIFTASNIEKTTLFKFFCRNYTLLI